MIEILRHVDRQPKLLRTQYPNSYLKLPLLKFEMLNVRSAAPEIYEENSWVSDRIVFVLSDHNKFDFRTVDVVMHVLKRKLYKLMKGYLVEMKPALIARNREEYHADFLASHNMYEQVIENAQQMEAIDDDDLLVENKTLANVPCRQQIKMQSAKFLEELAKRDE